MRILVARTDRLGDVVMALPALDFLRRARPEAAIDFTCSAAFRKCFQPFLHARGIRWVAQSDLDLKAYSSGLFLNTDTRLLLRAWKARLPTRVGVLSRWPSFLLLNKGLRQVRSSARKNEGQYSLELAEHLVGRTDSQPGRLVLEGDPASEAAAREVLSRLGVPKKFVVLHPGTGGTAINLSPAQWGEVLRSLDGFSVVLSRGPSAIDSELVEYLLKNFGKVPVLENVELDVLREVFRKARAVVGPSTGPLHLAHVVGTRAVGLYAPISAQSPSRWGFWGGVSEATVLAPAVDCPGTSRCIGPRCPEYFCMEKVTWARRVVEAVESRV